MKTRSTVLIVCLLAVVPALLAMAQQCGPGCPACSGKAIGDLLPEKTILGTGIPLQPWSTDKEMLRSRKLWCNECPV